LALSLQRVAANEGAAAAGVLHLRDGWDRNMSDC
jgi:hypothetical protein